MEEARGYPSSHVFQASRPVCCLWFYGPFLSTLTISVVVIPEAGEACPPHQSLHCDDSLKLRNRKRFSGGNVSVPTEAVEAYSHLSQNTDNSE